MPAHALSAGRQRPIDPPMAASATASKTVVVADETPDVRNRFAAALADAGHTAIGVGTAPELLACLQARSDAVDLVVLNLRLVPPPAGGPDSRGPRVRRLPVSHPDLQRLHHERAGDPAARGTGRGGLRQRAQRPRSHRAVSGAPPVPGQLQPAARPPCRARHSRRLPGSTAPSPRPGPWTSARGGSACGPRVRFPPARRSTCGSGCRPRNAPSKRTRAWSGATGAAAWGCASSRSGPRIQAAIDEFVDRHAVGNEP